MSLFLCPICRQPLAGRRRAILPPRGHSYDIASAGYVHLLPAKEAFLCGRATITDGGCPQPFSQRGLVSAAAGSHSPDRFGDAPQGGTFFDSGCGEGTTSGARRPWMPRTVIPGFMALRHFQVFCAGRPSGFQPSSLPWPRHIICLCRISVDVLLNCFFPAGPGGIPAGAGTRRCVYVVPAPRHLWELKQAVYDTP